MREVAHDLGALYECDAMLTLTLPGEWQSVCPDGRRFKRHVRALRKRLGRYLEACGVSEWGALWFLEFQERGAPHLHACFWGVEAVEVEAMRVWIGEAWAAVVGHADAGERAKHRAAGTKWERSRARHFGYASKYASKMRQKRVPDGFRDVGRFWGIWRGSAPKPVVWAEHRPLGEVRALLRDLAELLPEEALRFAGRVVSRFDAAVPHSDVFAATIYGRRCVDFLLHGGSVVASSGASPPRLAERCGVCPRRHGRGLGASVCSLRCRGRLRSPAA